MECKSCASCGRAFRPRPQVPQQRFCCAADCQRARKRLWQRAKRASDPDYRANQAEAQQGWSSRHPGYWQAYRCAHPEYVERNRRRRRERYRQQRACPVAKMDVCKDRSFVPSGTYRLSAVSGGDVAKMDAWMVEITLLSLACAT
jgi:hypothetical protein